MLDDSDNVDAEVFAKSISNYYVMSYEFNINVPQVLAESVSDMLNTEFSKSVSDILETCGERLAAGGSKLCPPPEVFSSFYFCFSSCSILHICRWMGRVSILAYLQGLRAYFLFFKWKSLRTQLRVRSVARVSVW